MRHTFLEHLLLVVLEHMLMKRRERTAQSRIERHRWTGWRILESGGQTGRRLPGNQTENLMICSRHSQCETGRLARPR